MNIQGQIDEMKRWLDDLAGAYEIRDPDEATKAILAVIVRLQLRLDEHAVLALEPVWEDPPEDRDEPEEDNEGGSDD